MKQWLGKPKKLVCGVDEVGRGCLAGPVVAAAVIFPVGARIANIRDSKLISAQELPVLAQKIRENGLVWVWNY